MRSRAIVVGAVLGAAVVAGGWLVQRGLAGSAHEYAGARLFEEVLAHVSRDYVDSLPDSLLYRRAVDGLLAQLDDPNSVYLDEERLARLNERTSGNYVGLGLRFDVRNGWITVIAPLQGSPAERAGVTTGDRIVEIDGTSTRGMTPDEASNAMRGEPGTTAQLVVERAVDGQRVRFSLPREPIHVGTVQRASVLPGGVGFVDVNVFGDSTAKELELAVDSLVRRGITGLVVDFRRNPGGLLPQGIAVADLFLDDGRKIMEMRGRGPETSATYVDHAAQRWPKLPVVVLVNEGTASASEIVAGALQDHDRAVILGRSTFGKGSAQSVYPLPEGGALKLTTARWYTPLGRAIGRPFGAETPQEDENALESARPPEHREEFRTPSGRIVYGGGGIRPDVIVGDTVLPPAELHFQQELGTQLPLFRDALTDYALDLRASGTVERPDFSITPAMRDALWARMRRRGIDVPREVYDAARPLVDRLLVQDIARYVFGGEVAVRRLAEQDRAIQAALRLLRGARTPAELLKAAERQAEADARRADVARAASR
ncbi:MAG TPA: S41 family peptidase [Gemmatimonadaceae bacterium]|nr:S41 family peptidase [Gemmatimonadaceae bacterium]